MKEKVLSEAVENAWMIRNDGRCFRVLQHIYGSEESIEETLAAAEWLYSATGNSGTRRLIIDFIASWAASLDSGEPIVDTIYAEVDDRPYKFLSTGFIDDIAYELDAANCYQDVEELNQLIVNELNQEFLRARYGGMYNSTRGNRDMIFRVSSADFNWFNIIFNFVYEHKNMIDTVTVVKDEESTGYDTVYSHKGVMMDKLPVEEFIMLSGRPVIESFAETSIETALQSGKSIVESMSAAMNFNRINSIYKQHTHKYHHKEAII